MLAFIRCLIAKRAALIAENLFLRKQLALFQERKVKPRRCLGFSNGRMRSQSLNLRPSSNGIARCFGYSGGWKSRKKGRPRLPANLRALIQEMARANLTWGEERIANELQVKLGIRVSPRTIRKYLSRTRPGGSSDQRWATFIRNHAGAIVACDFFVSVTATFKVLYAFVTMEIGSRRILPRNVTEHPTAEWTTQQFREVLADVHPYRFVIHDRDSIFSATLEETLKSFGVRTLRTPIQAPKANAFCERLIGTIRRECLDYLIPINERHLRRVLREFAVYYNRGRPHASLGPGIPPPNQATVPASGHRRRLATGYCVTSRTVLGGLHHDYRLEKEVA